MKKLLPVAAVLLTVSFAWAQQDAQYSQFFMTKLTYNPAFAGAEEKICATGLYRSQWLGFGSAERGLSPTTFLANIHAPIGQSFGVGLNISSDQLGFFDDVNPMLSVSYRRKFSNEGVLSLGLAGGIMQRTIDGTKLKPRQDGDPLIPTQSVSDVKPDVNLGLYYMLPNLWRFESFYAGLSASHLNQARLEFGSTSLPLVMHYYFMTGASYPLLPSLSLEPNILVKTDIAKTTADINVMATFNNKIRGGLSYRTSDAVVVLLGYKFLPELMVGYSYDLTTSNITNYSSGSHEIMLRYCFMPKIKERDPKPVVPRLTPRFL